MGLEPSPSSESASNDSPSSPPLVGIDSRRTLHRLAGEVDVHRGGASTERREVRVVRHRVPDGGLERPGRGDGDRTRPDRPLDVEGRGRYRAQPNVAEAATSATAVQDPRRQGMGISRGFRWHARGPGRSAPHAGRRPGTTSQGGAAGRERCPDGHQNTGRGARVGEPRTGSPPDRSGRGAFAAGPASGCARRSRAGTGGSCRRPSRGCGRRAGRRRAPGR